MSTLNQETRVGVQKLQDEKIRPIYKYYWSNSIREGGKAEHVAHIEQMTKSYEGWIPRRKLE